MHPCKNAALFIALAASPALTPEALATAPRYKMVLSAENAQHGVKCISFVENPAIQRGWVALSAATAPITKRVHLSEAPAKQVLTGPALVPGQEILRLDEQGKPFYISFDAETIAAAQRRFAKDGQHKNTNQDHSLPLDGNIVEESWIVLDSEKDKAAALGLDVPVGTWMLSVHVPDAEYWEKEVVSGNKTGFSIEALFDAQELKLAAVEAKKPMSKKSFWARLGAAGRDLLNLSEVELKGGKRVDIAEDGTVSLLDDEGNITGPAPDGEHELADGKKLTVKDGKKVDAPADEPEQKVEAADEPTAEAELQAQIQALTSENEALKAKIAEMEGKAETALTAHNTALAAVELKLAEAEAQLSKEPAGTPLHLSGDTGQNAGKSKPKHLAFLEAHTKA